MKHGLSITLNTFLTILLLTPAALNAQSVVMKSGTTIPQLANVTVVSTSDPAGHACCTEPPPAQLEIRLELGKLWISEPGGIEGTFGFGDLTVSEDLEVNDERRSTVAGFTNVQTILYAFVGRNTLELEYTIGADGGLPTGQPIIHELVLSPALGTEWFFDELTPDTLGLQAALGNSFIYIAEEETQSDAAIDLFLLMDINGEDTNSDWWIVLLHDDLAFSFDLTTGQFEPGLIPTYQGPLIDVLEPVQLLDDYLPPSNDFTIVFGVDADPNGLVDLDLLRAAGYHYFYF